MKKLKDTGKLIIVIIILIIIIMVIIIKDRLERERYENILEVENTGLVKKEDDEENTTCMVDIKGEVINPGVYTTECTDNVSDVIRLAGGTTENADTSVTNLAKKITNEMVIIIYSKEEVKNSNIVDTVVKVVEGECVCPNIQNDGCINTEIDDTISNQNKLININTATLEELKTIPGIGDARAKAIIEYRKKNGNFKTIEDIKNVSGIGNSLYEEIKAYIET